MKVKGRRKETSHWDIGLLDSQMEDLRQNEETLKNHYYLFNKVLADSKIKFDSKWLGSFKNYGDIQDFTLLQMIGSGGFGKVIFAKHRTKSEPYVAKVMEKKEIVTTKRVDAAHAEIRTLDAVEFEFLVSLECLIISACYIYIIMPCIPGADMFTHLRKMRRFEENLSRFYAAQVVLALEYLHYVGLIYRDLKPENILIDSDGYIKIVDFGFCKKVDQKRTYTLCGTPDYLAPEIILCKGYNKSVDWWCLGVLIFEMTAGYTPFSSKEPMMIYDKIINGEFIFPKHFSRHLQLLLSRMIEIDRTKRYGMLKNGSNDIKEHKWFSCTNWDGLLAKQVEPVYKPTIDSHNITSNFDQNKPYSLRDCDVDEYTKEFADIKVKLQNVRPRPFS